MMRLSDFESKRFSAYSKEQVVAAKQTEFTRE
jgi:hypothetical protein